MGLRKIEVTAYEGYRSGEQPRSFVLEGTMVGVAEVIHRWIEESVQDRQLKRCFRVKGDDGVTYLITYMEQTDEWFLE